MFYYVDSIEQVTTDTEGVYNEYGARTKYATYKAAETKYYEKLMNVSNSSAHVFMDIKITNSVGGKVKNDQIGAYINEEETE